MNRRRRLIRDGAFNQGFVPLPIVSATIEAVYGANKIVEDYTGPLFRVVRSSDNATMDVYPSGAAVWPDTAAVDAWAAGSALRPDIWYEQKGSGKNLTQTTANVRPYYTSVTQVGNKRPLTFATEAGTNLTQRFVVPNTLVIERQNIGVHQVLNPRSGYADRLYWEFNDGTTNAYIGCFQNNIGFGTYPTTTFFNGRLKAKLQAQAVTNSAATQKIYKDGIATSSTARPAQSMASGGMVGATVTNLTQYWSTDDKFSLIYFSTTPSDSDITAMDEWAAQVYPINSGETKRLVYGGSSLVEGWGATLNQTALWQMQLDNTWEAYNMGRGGQTLATEYANRATREFLLYDATKAKNVLVIDAPSNDINAQTFANQAAAESYADTLYTATTLAFVSAAISTGFDVVVPTVIGRTGFTTGNFKQYALLRYNSNVTGGAVANNYVASDRYGDSRLQDASNTTYFNADGIHPKDAGYAVMAEIDKAAILAA